MNWPKITYTTAQIEMARRTIFSVHFVYEFCEFCKRVEISGEDCVTILQAASDMQCCPYELSRQIDHMSTIIAKRLIP